MKIGTFTKTENGFTGKIETLAIKAPAIFEAVEKDSDKHPDYAIIVDNQKIGAAWSHTSEDREPYISVQFEEPSLADGFYKLVKSGIEHTYTLTYQRSKPKKKSS